MHKFIPYVFSASALLLFSCSEQKAVEPVAVEEEVVKSLPPAVLVTNFTLSSFAKELIDPSSITLFDPVPVGKDPLAWKPSQDVIDQINAAQPLIFVTGKAPAWIKQLDNSLGVVDLITGTQQELRATSDIRQANLIFKKMSSRINFVFPEANLKPSSLKYLNELATFQQTWEKLPADAHKPEHNLQSSIKPSSGEDFVRMLKVNYGKPVEALAVSPHNNTVEEGVTTTDNEESAHTAESNDGPKKQLISFEDTIVPILENTCLDCHDAVSEEGDLNLEHYLTEREASLQPELWETVAKVIELGQMPPKKQKDQLSDEDKKNLHNWTENLLVRWDTGQMGKDPGKTTVHRINKNEYNYTTTDLFSLKRRHGSSFPEDGGGESGFDNNADFLFLPPLLVENYFEAAGKIVEEVFGSSTSKNRYLIAKPGSDMSADDAARTTLNYWASFMYRKRVADSELKRLFGIYKKDYAKSKSYEKAMRGPLFTMLISPNFLYKSSLTKEEKGKHYPLNDFELASKLSYFLWSSMPDRTLFKIAAQGKLSDPEVYDAQIKRMLKDKKASRLGMHFGGQWFGWEKLRGEADPDQEKYPEFNLQLRVDLYKESTRFFNDLVLNNGSIYNLIDSDYTFLNSRLAKFYNISGVTGTSLQKVQLTDANRGGVLGMGSVLTASALPLRSSPSIRGAFVVQDILGLPLPEPPMNVEQLPEDDRTIGKVTFRESLTAHRDNPACSSCHSEIDPIGFSLELFDAIGRFRTHQNGAKIDATGQLPDGTKFSSPAELKKALMSKKELFAKNTVKKMLSYALGRELTPFDRPTIKDITDKVIADDGNIQTAFLEVAKSFPFTNRRGDDYKTKAITSIK